MDSIEWIDRYLSDELAPAQRAELEKRLRQDAELQALFDSVVLAREAVRTSALRQRVRALHGPLVAEIRAEETPVVTNNATDGDAGGRVVPLWRIPPARWVVRFAASVVLLLVGYSAYQYAVTNPDTYYNAKFVQYQLPTTRANATERTRLDSLYRTGNFAAVTQAFTTLPAPTPRDYFLAGVSYMQQRQFEPAIAQFTALRAQNRAQRRQFFEQETDYYLALAYVGAGRVAEAIPLFEKIKRSPQHLYHRNVVDRDMWRLTILSLKQ